MANQEERDFEEAIKRSLRDVEEMEELTKALELSELQQEKEKMREKRLEKFDTPKQVVTVGSEGYTCKEYEGYWERQHSMQCGLHALRMICYSKHVKNISDFIEDVQEKIQNLQADVPGYGIVEQNKPHCENLNMETMLLVMQKYGLESQHVDLRPGGAAELNLTKVESNIFNPQDNLRGYLINKRTKHGNHHWYAIRKGTQEDKGCWYNLDSWKREKEDAISAISAPEVFKHIQDAVSVLEVRVSIPYKYLDLQF